MSGTVKALDRMTRFEAVRLWLAGEWRHPANVTAGEYVMHPADETLFCLWWNCRITQWATEVTPVACADGADGSWAVRSVPDIPTNTKGMLRVTPYDKWTQGQ